MIPAIIYEMNGNHWTRNRRLQRRLPVVRYSRSILCSCSVSLCLFVLTTCFDGTIAQSDVHDVVYPEVVHLEVESVVHIGTILDDDDDEQEDASSTDDIILMSIHEIDPIEEHIAAVAEQDMHVEGNSDDSIDEDEIESNDEEDTAAVEDDTWSSDDSDNQNNMEDDNDSPSKAEPHSFDDGEDDEEDSTTGYQTADTAGVHHLSTNSSSNHSNHIHHTSLLSTPTPATLTSTPTLVEDDRSLLDLFAESAKVYLTQQMIPPTDLDCQWDWRSLQCESHCYCSLQWQMGDYHLGRACRRYRSSTTNSSHVDETTKCVPTTYILDQPIPRRLVSLIRQTTDILRLKIQHTIQTIVRNVHDRYRIVQRHQCSDLYSHVYVTTDGSQCWVLLPESLTLLEQIFCGRKLRQTIPVCQPGHQ